MSHQPAKTYLLEYAELIRRGQYFEAHEVMETVWIEAGRRRGDLWQGLTQLAVALTHASRGNFRGAGRVYQKAMEKLEHATRTDPVITELLDFARGKYFALMAPSTDSESD